MIHKLAGIKKIQSLEAEKLHGNFKDSNTAGKRETLKKEIVAIARKNGKFRLFAIA